MSKKEVDYIAIAEEMERLTKDWEIACEQKNKSDCDEIYREICDTLHVIMYSHDGVLAYMASHMTADDYYSTEPNQKYAEERVTFDLEELNRKLKIKADEKKEATITYLTNAIDSLWDLVRTLPPKSQNKMKKECICLLEKKGISKNQMLLQDDGEPAIWNCLICLCNEVVTRPFNNEWAKQVEMWIRGIEKRYPIVKASVKFHNTVRRVY